MKVETSLIYSAICQDSLLNRSTSSLGDILKHQELFSSASSESGEEDDKSILSSSVSSSSTSFTQAIFIDKVLTSEMSPPP